MDVISLQVFAVSLAVTAAVYGAFPILYAWCKKAAVTRARYRTLCICVTAAIALSFGVFSSLAGQGISFSPALLWGFIFYNVGKSHLKMRGLLVETGPDRKPPAAPAGSVKPEETVELFEGQPVRTVAHLHKAQPEDSPQEPVKPFAAVQEKHWNIPALALGVLLAASIGLNVWTLTKAAELENQLDQQLRQYKTMEEELKNQLKAKQDLIEDLSQENFSYAVKQKFMEDSVVFVTVGGTRYHRYECHYFQDASHYFAFNVGYARARGYTPCLECDPPT